MKVLIIGNGIAGNETAFKLRKLNSDIEITIISAEKYPEYDPCSLPYYIGGDISRKIVFRKKLYDYKINNINLVLDNEVTSIDTKAKNVTTVNGKNVLYDKLVLAYGGGVFVPPIKGIGLKGVFCCKKLSDAEKIIEHKGKKAVVVGSGAIGVEVAEALKKKGYDVVIIELLDRILPTMFDEYIAKKLEKALINYGINVLVNEKVEEVIGISEVTGIKTDKREIKCDTVIFATGVVIDKTLARSANINTNKGIIVNNYLKTNIKDIYACGDCIESKDAITGEDCLYQLKHNAIEQAYIVSQNISGCEKEYIGAYPFARAYFFETRSCSFGKTLNSYQDKKNIELIKYEKTNDYLQIILKDGKIVGAQSIGRYGDNIGLLMGAMWREDDINNIRKNKEAILQIGSKYPWTYRKLISLLDINVYKKLK